MKQKLIMKKAWNIARLAAKKFGNNSRDYMFSKNGALSLAWKFHKETTEKLAGLLGNSKEKRKSIKIIQKWYKNTAKHVTDVVKKSCEFLFKRKQLSSTDYKTVFSQVYLSS